jgi:methionyl-tRNA formyltransferase
MGTPEFAVPSLKAILGAGFNVVGVITSPDRGAGRGRKIKFSAIKRFVIENGLNLIQPENLRNPDFIDQLKQLRPDLQVVIAFRMLPEEVWSIPRLGTMNLHASMLPQYRGAAPINHAILNGEKKTGLTTFFIDEKIDTGEIIDQIEIDIVDNETFGELHDRLKELGSGFVVGSINKILEPGYKLLSQNSLLEDVSELKKAPKISKVFCQINWNQPMDKIYNFIRALSPYPAAFGYLINNKNDLLLVKCFITEKKYRDHSNQHGSILSDRRTYLWVAVQGGFISIIELQLMGKRRMTIKELLNGFHLSNDAAFKVM